MSDTEKSSVITDKPSPNTENKANSTPGRKEGYKSRCSICGTFYFEIPEGGLGTCSNCFSRNSVVPLRQDHEAVGVNYFMKHRWGTARLASRIAPQNDKEYDDTGAEQQPQVESTSDAAIPPLPAVPASRPTSSTKREKETTTCGSSMFGNATPVSTIGTTGSRSTVPNIFGPCTSSPVRNPKGRGGSTLPPLNPLATVPGFTSEKVLLNLVEKRLKMWDDTPEEEIFGGYQGGGGGGGIPLAVVCGFLPQYWKDLEDEL